MSCNCKTAERTTLWTPIPDYRQATAILPGENVDCYMKRAGNVNGSKVDVEEKKANSIDNTAITSDLNGKVDETFKLSPNSTDTAVTWRIWINGSAGIPAGMGLVFNTSTGQLSGTVADDFCNKNYKVLIKAFKDDTTEIDSREFNLFPKKGGKEETLKFVFPYSGKSKPVITSPFGPRKSGQHDGIDIAQAGRVIGDILSTADGVVVRCGPGSGWGNVIFIDHKDSKGTLVATSVYGHWSEAYVTKGQKVSAGQKIAKEGNVGHSSAPHLHFEIHKGGYKNPVDPMQYLNGTYDVAGNNLPNSGGQPDPSTVKPQTKTNAGMTSSEAVGKGSGSGEGAGGSGTGSSDCATRLPNQAGDTGPPTNPSSTTTASPQPALGTEPAAPPIKPSTADTQAAIQKALDEDPSLTEADKAHLKFVAKIESNNKADAKNPTSSARGIYQMLDKTAEANYKKIGVEPTVENRNDPYLATKAQIAFYKAEQKPAWEAFQASGGTKIAGKTLTPEVQSRYANYTQGEFTYGLIHHDGIGNAVKGNDLQGVDYYRKKVREA